MSTKKDYTAAAEWAEHEMALPHNSATAVRGEEAAAYGRSVLERALGGRLAHQQHRTTSDVLRDAVAEYLNTHAAASS